MNKFSSCNDPGCLFTIRINYGDGILKLHKFSNFVYSWLPLSALFRELMALKKEQHMVYSISVRRMLVLVLMGGLGLLVAARAFYRCYSEPERCVVLDEGIDRTKLALREQADVVEQQVNVDGESTGAYDFSTILKLIDLVRVVKDNGAVDHAFVPRRRKIDTEEIKTLLAALLREREALRVYIWNLKGHSKVGIPPRRSRALLYYTEVLDSMVSQMRELMSK